MKYLIGIFFMISTFFSWSGFEPYLKQIKLLQKGVANKEYAKVDSLSEVIMEMIPEDSILTKTQLYYLVAVEYDIKGEVEQAEKYFLKSIDFQKEHNITSRLVDVYLGLGVMYYNHERIYEALSQFKSSLELSIQLEDRYGIALSYNNIGLIFLFSNSYDEAQKYFEMSLENMTENQSDLEAAIYTNLGLINYFQDDYKPSLKYLNQAEKIIRNNPDYLDEFAFANVKLL